MKVFLELSHNTINREIPYAVICEGREGARWNTGRRRRRWCEEFSEKERKAASRLFALAHRWYLVKGAPDKVMMTPETYALWNKLGAFCTSL